MKIRGKINVNHRNMHVAEFIKYNCATAKKTHVKMHHESTQASDADYIAIDPVPINREGYGIAPEVLRDPVVRHTARAIPAVVCFF